MTIKFKSPKIQCNNCKEIISSTFEGHYVICKCNLESSKQMHMAYIDIKPLLQNQSQGRFESSDEHKLRCILHKYFGTGIMIDATMHYMRTAGDYTLIEEGNGYDK